MSAALGGILDAERKALASATGAPAIAPELLEKLGALGYVGGGGAAETATPGADPKDKVEDFRIANDQVREGLLRLHDRDYARSVARFREVLAHRVSSFEVHFYLARALFALRQNAEAAKHFEEAARRAPSHGPAWEGWAESLAAAGQPERGLEVALRGQKVLPRSASLRAQEGALLEGLGRKAEARRAYEAALPLAPRNARLRSTLGELLRGMGEIDEAIRRQREATELDPAVAGYWNSLGMTLGGNGRMAEAELAFREACRRDDKSHLYAYNLGLILLRQGRPDESRPFFEDALRLNPQFAPAHERLAELRSASSRGAR